MTLYTRKFLFSIFRKEFSKNLPNGKIRSNFFKSERKNCYFFERTATALRSAGTAEVGVKGENDARTSPSEPSAL